MVDADWEKRIYLLHELVRLVASLQKKGGRIGATALSLTIQRERQCK